jgi:hypothetical protein
MTYQSYVMALTDNALNAVQAISSGIATWRSIGSTSGLPFSLRYLARAHSELGNFDDARRCINEAIALVETTKDRWCEAEVYWVAGKSH